MIFNKLMADYIESINSHNDINISTRIKKTYPHGKDIICLKCNKPSFIHANRKTGMCDSCDLLYNPSKYNIIKRRLLSIKLAKQNTDKIA